MRSTGEPDFDAAWQAFAREEARVAVPADLEARVLGRARRSTRADAAYRPRWRAPALAATAATMVLTAIAVFWPGSEREDLMTALPASMRPPHATLRAPVADRRPPIEWRGPLVRHEPRPRLEAVSRAVLAELPPPLLRFSPQPIGEAEVLQIVRLRLPREALQALGVALVEPDAEGMVDVDVLVGEDGLARDIRQVTTGQESGS